MEDKKYVFIFSNTWVKGRRNNYSILKNSLTVQEAYSETDRTSINLLFLKMMLESNKQVLSEVQPLRQDSGAQVSLSECPSHFIFFLMTLGSHQDL